LRTLLFSDVHSNIEALEAVLADASTRGFDRAVCLGDIVGYGADPEACTSRVSGLPQGAAVLGNHDAAVIDLRGRGDLNPVAREGVKYSEKKLSAKSIDYLGTLPLVFDSSEVFVACHASPQKPHEWPYILDPPEAREALRATTRPLIFIGHTHYPLLHDGFARSVTLSAGAAVKVRAGERYIVNVGSVGQPRDGDPRAAYVIFDDVERAVRLFRVRYDVDTAARKILDAGLPEILADRIRRGY
jgi:diadenosine tetraphosphatase ApaH/serine/threonine PP2A family protein phosphatase